MRIARPFGIPVYISPYWFLIAGVFVLLYANSPVVAASSGVRYLVAAAFVVLLYVSVLVHELSHSLVARGFGLPVRRILLYPLGGFSEIEQEPPTPAREFLVSAACPLLSLVLAAVGYGILLTISLRGLPELLIQQLVWANLLVGLFNLLPGLPLDGGRMLRAGVWKVTRSPTTGTVVAAWAGRVLAVAVLVVPLIMLTRAGGRVQIFDVVWLGVIAAFMWTGRPSRCGPPGSGSGCPGCRPGRWPGAPSPSPRRSRWRRQSAGPTRPGRGPWSWWTTRTSRSRS